MPLNVVSNYAANVAHRNLARTDMEASASLSKLSIGKRVVSARDDAASMAIGSRMNAEVKGLQQAVVNAGQANSMLQIADGAMSTISDILTRMKVLSTQASSANLSATEREFLKDASGGRLADASHSGEHVGLRDPAGTEGVGQRANHRLLADQVGEARRPIFPGEHPVGSMRYAVVFGAVHPSKHQPFS
jgi:hypothetical protein